MFEIHDENTTLVGEHVVHAVDETPTNVPASQLPVEEAIEGKDAVKEEDAEQCLAAETSAVPTDEDFGRSSSLQVTRRRQAPTFDTPTSPVLPVISPAVDNILGQIQQPSRDASTTLQTLFEPRPAESNTITQLMFDIPANEPSSCQESCISEEPNSTGSIEQDSNSTLPFSDTPDTSFGTEDSVPHCNVEPSQPEVYKFGSGLPISFNFGDKDIESSEQPSSPELFIFKSGQEEEVVSQPVPSESVNDRYVGEVAGCEVPGFVQPNTFSANFSDDDESDDDDVDDMSHVDVDVDEEYPPNPPPFTEEEGFASAIDVFRIPEAPKYEPLDKSYGLMPPCSLLAGYTFTRNAYVTIWKDYVLLRAFVIWARMIASGLSRNCALANDLPRLETRSFALATPSYEPHIQRRR